MGDAIGQVLSLGVGVALSPVPIIAVVLLLGTPRARSTAPAFLLGWLAGPALIGTVVLLVAGGVDASDNGAPAAWASWLKLALGALMLFMAVRTWRRRPKGDQEPTMPAWMSALDEYTAGKALGIGVVLSGVNPKNLALTIAAGTAIAATGASTGEQFVALAVFVVIGALGPGLPVAVYFAMGSRAQHVLADWKDWMTRHNAAIMTTVLLLIGTKIVGDAVSGLTG